MSRFLSLSRFRHGGALRACGLLLLLVLGALGYSAGQKAYGGEERPDGERSARDWIALFQVPASEDAWEINSVIKGHYVRLRLPQESAKIALLPPEVRAIVEQRALYRQNNLKILRNTFALLDTHASGSGTTLGAEYRQSLSRVALSVFPDQAHSPLWRHEPLIKAMPPYTQFDVFVPRQLAGAARVELDSWGVANRATVHEVELWSSVENGELIQNQPTRWARDLMETLVDPRTGRTTALLPLARAQGTDLARSDNDYLQVLGKGDIDILRVPLFFRSGNLVMGEARGRRYLFIGERELRHLNAYFYNAFFFMPPQAAVLELLKVLTGVDEVVELPNSEHLFHLDMALIILGDGKAGVLEPIGIENMLTENSSVIVTIRNTLESLGFAVVGVPTTPERIRNFQSPVNALPFKHAHTGTQMILVPRFPHSPTLLIQQKEIRLRELVEQAYLAAGYETIYIEDRFHDEHGNLHCAVMVIK